MNSIQYSFGGSAIPLVSIHLMQDKPAKFRRKVGEIVSQTMVETINVPSKDPFQNISEKGKLVIWKWDCPVRRVTHLG